MKSQIPNPKQEKLTSKPPVVVILGHVDHGKSSILEAIKDLKITEKESGGITQHIGAYEIEHQGKKITFIDTPGHEAFSAIRSRGAKVADIAILVIAAEEGIRNQTKEAISHIKKTGIPMIIVLNKIDKPTADPERVKDQLAQLDILVESRGGKVPCVEASAKTKKGISDILEIILLVAEIEDLKADLSQTAEGVVIDAYLDKSRGPSATLLLNNGILKKGDVIATRSVLGKAKILEDFQNQALKQALPSQPVIVLGFEKQVSVGEKFRVYPDVKSAQEYIAGKSLEVAREKEASAKEVFLVQPEQRVLNLIVKADVWGSVEAIKEILKGLPQEKVILRILKSEVGEINDSDVRLAKPARAIILGFRVKVNPIALKLAQREKIKIIQFEVIYEIVQELRKFMERLVKSKVIRTDLGKMKVLVVFRTEKNRQIVGGKIIQGEVVKGAKIEVFRDDEKIGQGKLIQLQKNKKEIKKGIRGDEVGILYQGNVKIEQGNILVIYQEETQKGEL